MHLKDPSLLRSDAFIDGAWCAADDGATADIRNPADGSIVGTVPVMRGGETRRAIEAAARALPEWSKRTAKERATVLRRFAEAMIANADDLAIIMTSEQGKPLAEARGEIGYAASFLEWFAEEGKRVYGEIIPTFRADARLMVLRQPVGVAAGCTFVCKPAPQTPFSALALAELGRRAGLPDGVLNIVTGDAAAIGSELTGNPLVRKFSFTGSTAVGKTLLAQCAGTVKKVSLELGGNAPFIVFEDADLEAAVQGVMASKYRNTGQTCVCANRLFVHTSVYDEFAARLVTAVSALRVGAGLSGPTDQGPLIDERALAKVEAHVADAVAQGARIASGGRRHALGGNFYEPTVLLDVTPGMRVAREETFGPVAPLIRFTDEAEVLRLANDTAAGLAAYFFTRDLARSWRVQEALEYGLIGVNTGLISTEVAPFGGVKESGLGREGSRHGIDDYTELKYVCVGGLSQ